MTKIGEGCVLAEGHDITAGHELGHKPTLEMQVVPTHASKHCVSAAPQDTNTYPNICGTRNTRPNGSAYSVAF